MRISIYILLTLIGLAFTAEAATRITCHKPFSAKNGADVIGEIEIEQSQSMKNKQLITSGRIFVKAYSGSKEILINTDVMSGQSVGATKYLIFADDLRVHSIVVDGLKSDDSMVRLNIDKKTIEFPTECSRAPKIPKKKKKS